jgi:hypothetical protein
MIGKVLFFLLVDLGEGLAEDAVEVGRAVKTVVEGVNVKEGKMADKVGVQKLSPK